MKKKRGKEELTKDKWGREIENGEEKGERKVRGNKEGYKQGRINGEMI